MSDDELIAENRAALQRVVTVFVRRWPGLLWKVQRDDLEQMAAIGLLKAARTFRPGGMKWSRWLDKTMQNCIIDQLRAIHVWSRPNRPDWGKSALISLDAWEEPDERLHPTVGPTFEAEIATAQQREILGHAIARLRRDEQICLNGMLAGRSQEDIGRVLHVAGPTVSRIITRAIPRIQARLTA